MSSLMQHHGTIRGNKVELLMYLQRRVESPAKCMWCGASYDVALRAQVCSCGRAVIHLFIQPAHGLQVYNHPNTDTIELYKEWTPETKAIAEKLLPAESNSCYISNSWHNEDVETLELVWPSAAAKGSIHRVPRLYRIWRSPVDILGCWVRFRWNGKLHSPDLSVPISVYELPKDAKPLTNDEMIAYWRRR